jgi:hypothetical protein
MAVLCTLVHRETGALATYETAIRRSDAKRDAWTRALDRALLAQAFKRVAPT